MSSDQEKSYSEPKYANSSKPKTSYPWYNENIDKYLTSETRGFLSKYCKIPFDQQSKHVHSIRDQAWAIRSYPCTGLGVWLVPYISRSPAYSRILKTLQAGGILLDVGCFLGADLRQLVFDGAPSNNMYGVDIVSHWEVGFNMYLDKDTFNAHFINSDIMLEDNSELAKLKNRVDIISISAVMHQWTYDRQVECGIRLVSYSKAGTIILGYQMGNAEGKDVTLGPGMPPTWRHNPKSFEDMWNDVGKKTGTTWKTEARMQKFEDIGWDPNDHAWMEDGVGMIDFVIERME